MLHRKGTFNSKNGKANKLRNNQNGRPRYWSRETHFKAKVAKATLVFLLKVVNVCRPARCSSN